MSTRGGPGQGTTFALSADTTLSRVRDIQLPEWSTEPVDFTGLDELEWFTMLAATLKDGGVAVVSLFHDSEIVLPTLGLVQTATIQLPIQSAGNSTRAQLTGSGFVTSLGLPAAATGEPLIQTVAFRFDGDGTPPSYTPESA